MKENRLDSGKSRKSKWGWKKHISIILAVALLVTLPIVSSAAADTAISGGAEGMIAAEMPESGINGEAGAAGEPEETEPPAVCVCETRCAEGAANCTGEEAEEAEPQAGPTETTPQPVTEAVNALPQEQVQVTINFKILEANDWAGLLKQSVLETNGDGTVALPAYEDVFTAEDYEIPEGLVFQGWDSGDFVALEAGKTIVLSDGAELTAIFGEDPNALTRGTAAGGTVTTADEFVAALGGNATANGNEITLSDDITLTKTITISAGSYTLNGDGHTITRMKNFEKMFAVRGSGTELTLENVVLDGNKEQFQSGMTYASVCHVLSGGTLTLQSGAVAKNDFGSGAIVGSDATLNIEGGQILDNNKSGIQFYASSTSTVVNMKSGKIAGNNNTGICCSSSGTVNFSGGEISYNSITSLVGGGGIYVGSASLNLSGTARIINNTAGANGYGGGIYCGGRPTSFSGTPVISGNVLGGEVTGSDGTYTLTGGTENNLGFTKSEAGNTKRNRIISGELSAGANIGITSPVEEPIEIIANGLESPLGEEYVGATGYFRADSPNYVTTLNESGNIVLVPIETKYTLTGDPTDYYDTFAQAITAINNSASGGTINLLMDITLAANQTVGKDTVLLGGGHTITRGDGSGAMFTVDSGAMLVLGNSAGTEALTIDGNKANFPVVSGEIIDVKAGTLNMYDGVILQDNPNSPAAGSTLAGAGGVGIEGSSSFNMYGGGIRDCSGYTGGVIVSENASFTLAGGMICGNEGGDGGAVNVHGTFEMTGGTISYNSAVSGGYGGGVMMNNGAFNLKGGEISFNTAADEDNGGGIGNVNDYLNVEGSPVVKGNVEGGSITGSKGSYQLNGGTASNIRIYAGTPLNISGALTSGAQINVTGSSYSAYPFIAAMKGAGVTTGASYAGANGYIRSDSPNYITRLNADGNVTLEKAEVKYSLAGDSAEYGESLANAMAILNNSASGGTITLLTDVTLTAGQTVGKDAVILGGGHTITRGDSSGAMFTVDSGATLTLGTSVGTDTLALDGNPAALGGGGSDSIIRVEGGSLIMYGGVVLTDNNVSTGSGNNNGGAVYVNGGEFHMNGGRIQDCYATANGGGVYVSAGSFTLSDGLICGNQAMGAGGVATAAEGEFTMTGGSISYNRGNGYAVNPLGNFTISGGKIEYNIGVAAGGVGGNTVNMNVKGDPAIRNNVAGGLISGSDGTYTISNPGKEQNITIYTEAQKFNISGALTSGADIRVGGGSNYPVTVATNGTGTGLGAEYYGKDGYIRADNAAYVTRLNTDGNIELALALSYAEQPRDTLIPEKGGSISFAMDRAAAGLLSKTSVYTSGGAAVSGATITADGEKGITVTFSSENALAAGNYYVEVDGVRSDSFGVSTWSLSATEGAYDAELTAGEYLIADNNDSVKLTVNTADGNVEAWTGKPTLSLPGYTPELRAIDEVIDNRTTWGSADAMNKFGFTLTTTASNDIDMSGIVSDTKLENENTIRLYNAYALSEAVTGGSLKIPVKIMDGALTLFSANIEIPFSTQQATVSASVPIKNTSKIDAAGKITFPAAQISNTSLAPLQLTDVEMSWTADAEGWFSNVDALGAELGIGSNRYAFSSGSGGSMAYSIPAEVGKMKGGYAGKLTLDWGMTLGEGNVLKYWNAGESVHVADIVYTVKMA